MDPQLKAYFIFGAVIETKQLQALQAEVEGVRRAEDIECIHRMRVASRRLRAAQALFDGFLPKKKAKVWESEIRRITRSLGHARDLDVQLAELESFSLRAADPNFQPGIRRLQLRFSQQRNQAQIEVNAALQHLEESGILSPVTARLQALAGQKDQVYLYTPFLYQKAFQQIHGRLEDLLAYAPFVYQPEKAAELHAMRIVAKRLRYTLEIFSPLYPGELKDPLRAVRELQETLGSLHDADMWLGLLPEFLESEKQRIFQFYGRLRHYSPLRPGIQAFLEDQVNNREKSYDQVVAAWEKAGQQDIWNHLNETLQIPFQLEIPSREPAEPEKGLAVEGIHENRIDQ